MMLFDVFDMFEDVFSSEKEQELKYGDVIAVKRYGGVYEHFAVYIGNGRVIHYASADGDFGEGIIHEAPFENFIKDSSEYEILNFESTRSKPKRSAGIMPGASVFGGFYPTGPNGIEMLVDYYRDMKYHIYSPEETVERAKSRLGETKYNLVFNNCEHFAIWCKTGVHESRQVDELLKQINMNKKTY